MIVQHPMLWCAILLMAGIAVGLSFPLPYYLPLLIAVVIASTLTRKTRYIHDGLTLVIWFLLGCCRAAVAPVSDHKPAWQNTIEQQAQSVQTSLVARLERSGVSSRTLVLCSALVVGKKDGLERETRQAQSVIDQRR